MIGTTTVRLHNHRALRRFLSNRLWNLRSLPNAGANLAEAYKTVTADWWLRTVKQELLYP